MFSLVSINFIKSQRYFCDVVERFEKVASTGSYTCTAVRNYCNNANRNMRTVIIILAWWKYPQDKVSNQVNGVREQD